MGKVFDPTFPDLMMHNLDGLQLPTGWALVVDSRGSTAMHVRSPVLGPDAWFGARMYRPELVKHEIDRVMGEAFRANEAGLAGVRETCVAELRAAGFHEAADHLVDALRAKRLIRAMDSKRTRRGGR